MRTRRTVVIVVHAAPAGLRPTPVRLAVRRQTRIPRLVALAAMVPRASDAVIAFTAIEAGEITATNCGEIGRAHV